LKIKEPVSFETGSSENCGRFGYSTSKPPIIALPGAKKGQLGAQFTAQLSVQPQLRIAVVICKQNTHLIFCYTVPLTVYQVGYLFVN
jgi:hypothetical protein